MIAVHIAAMFFMSIAPRPHRQPSNSSPENGGRRHCEASASTTSRWAVSKSGGLAPVPRCRTIRLARPGAGSISSGW
jgi:hypothetical protein